VQAEEKKKKEGRKAIGNVPRVGRKHGVKMRRERFSK